MKNDEWELYAMNGKSKFDENESAKNYRITTTFEFGFKHQHIPIFLIFYGSVH